MALVKLSITCTPAIAQLVKTSTGCSSSNDDEETHPDGMLLTAVLNSSSAFANDWIVPSVVRLDISEGYYNGVHTHFINSDVSLASSTIFSSPCACC